jgi:hypothetical protein
MGLSREIKPTSTADAPTHPRPTTLMHVEYSDSGADEMDMAKASYQQCNDGEATVNKFRIPY